MAVFRPMISNGVIIDENIGVSFGTYTLTITDQNGCQAISEIEIFEGDAPLVLIEEFLCEGDSFQINNQMYFSDTIICEIYTLGNGCDSTHCIELNFTDIIYTNLTEEICEGENFVWNGITYSSDTIISTNYSSLSGCDSIVNFILEVFEFPEIGLNTSGSLCDGGEVEISSNPFNSYQWSTGESTPNIFIQNEGNYSITVTDNNGCEITDNIEIQIEALEVTYQIIPPSCFDYDDAIIQIENIVGGTDPYLLGLDGQTMQQSLSFENLESGTYNLQVLDVNACLEELEIFIDNPNEIIFETQNYYEVDLGESLELELITNISQPEVSWNPSMFLECDTCLATISQLQESIIYEITALDSNGCIIKTQIEIKVDPTLDVFIPNAFSPNDDGINDLFTIYSDASVSKINYLKIFDRWGEQVYEQNNFPTNSTSDGWDGRLKNRKMLDGVYVYIVEVERVDGTVNTFSGEVTLHK